MIFVEGIALGLVLLVLAGGRLRDAKTVAMRGENGLLAVLVVLAVLPTVATALGLAPAAVRLAWMAAIAALFGLAVYNWNESPGFRPLAMGSLLNLLVIVANARMPVLLEAANEIGGAAAVRAAVAGDVFHAAGASATRLSVLADVMPLPGLPPMRAIMSVGDVLMIIGTALVLVVASSRATLRDEDSRTDQSGPR